MRSLIRASKTGVAAALVGLLVMLSPFGVALEERFGLSWLFWTRGPLEPPSDVAVVSLDSASGERLGLSAKLREWPRRLYAQLIERLVDAEAAVIVFDLRLDQPREAADDAALAQAIAQAGRVVLFEYLELKNRPMPGPGEARAGVFTSERVHPPIAPFAEAAAGLGPFPLPKVPARVSQFWAFRPGGEPTLPVVALQRYAATSDRDWRAFLGAAGYPASDRLPSEFARLTDPNTLRRYMMDLRKAFRADPGLSARMAEQLADGTGEAEGRRVLTALLDAYEGPDSRYLNFYGSAGRVPTVPLHAVLERASEPASDQPLDLGGRVVFVGQSELMNLHDDGFITAFSRADGVDLSGVEIAATAFANFLDGRLLEPPGPGLSVVLLVAFGLAIGGIGGAFHAPIAVPSILFLGGSFYAAAALVFARQNLWLPVVTPLLVQLPLGLLLGLLLQYRDAHRARTNISRAMGYYLPRAVARGFAEEALDPSTLKEHVFAVCMLTDASRFTSLAEGMTPAELSEFLDRYFAILFGVVERYGGVVTDVVGDGTTSVWTAPGPERSCRLRACLAALEVSRAIDAFNERNQPRTMPTRIGLNAGAAMVGNVGGSGRFAYSVVGDCVNTASRLETLNKRLGTRIIAAAAVVEGLDEIVTRPLGRFQLFGKGAALAVVEVVGSAAELRRPETAPDFAAALPDFAAALEQFERGCWAAAAQRFDAVLAARPLDGPATFYRKYCEQYLNGTAAPTARGAIRLERK
ncbi:MAG TPA: adenylate/guanylate cyclase domain-containing protein [Geminicoccaceae bacterium]